MADTLRAATKNEDYVQADTFIRKNMNTENLKRNIWELVLTILFPGIGQVIYGRWSIGISLTVLNGLTLYILWFILMPISLGMLLHDRRE